jgi:hypothetical protein
MSEEMTIEKLYRYFDLVKLMNAKKIELDSVYMPVRSPSMENAAHGGKNESDPTAKAVQTADRIRKEFEDVQVEWALLRDEIDNWMYDKDVPEDIRMIVQYRFYSGYTWKQVSNALNPKQSDESSRMRFKRFFNKSR